MPDHVHTLVSIPPKISVSSFMGYLKGKSSPDDFLRSMAILNINLGIESFGQRATAYRLSASMKLRLQNTLESRKLMI